MSTWTKLAANRYFERGFNHVRWDVDGVEVLAYQWGVDPCEPAETCEPDVSWRVIVDGIELDEDFEEAAEFSNLADLRKAVEAPLKTRGKAVEVKTDFKKMSPLEVAKELYGITKRGYNPWEAYRWSTANDHNGSFDSFFLNDENVRSHINETYEEWLDDYKLDRAEVEGRKKKNPVASDSSIAKRMMNPRNY